MTDTRKLLERCARVMQYLNWTPSESGLFIEQGSRRGSGIGFYWSPLQSVTDAAELAIKCKVDVVWMRYEVWATQNGKGVAVPFKDHPSEQAAYCYAVCSVVAQMGGE